MCGGGLALKLRRNGKDNQLELLIPGNPIVLVPRISFNAQIGREGMSFQRVQFPLRLRYSLTINKSQGQTWSRIGLDLTSNFFAHGQHYVALSRAQSRHSIMCLQPPTHVLNGGPYTTNVVYSPFVDAATGDTINSKSPPPTSSFHEPSFHTRNLPTWSICRELGDGACGFRALARQILGDPSRHSQIRQQVVQ